MKRVAALLLGWAMTGCGGEGDEETSNSTPIAETPMAGTVAGAPWTLQAAETDAFLSDETSFWADLYAETLPACGNTFPSSPSITLLLPTMPGDYSLGTQYSATFYNPADDSNLAVTSGRIVVDSVTDTTISGGASFEFDANNKVDGRFTINICP